ncbi:DUF3413 domain-containing protein [Aliivibrio sp. S3MY1]|uniref:DUF3413 domain-containing protein n=1 Tax=unclassified Aliivibrio TaxID=2645654 RepID=UPI002377F5F8|nr:MULTISPECIES: DUF3413 domain-containing protein [unclassified Aliivibrio]MDD9196462.1 DUF3413 domain-containing protein [Aliivibrio sp. S3MY1]MDD9199147.1 DUF3413 domain-containing protein [Aliivibrio sp. S2MY1]
MVDSGNTYSDKVSTLITWGHWFSFFNIVAAMLIGTRYISQSPWPETLLGQTYLVLNWIGHFGFLVFGFYILVLFPLTFITPSQRLMRILSVIIATAGMTLLLLDTYAYQTLHLHITPLVWDMLLNNDKSNLNTQWQYLFVLIPVIFLLQLSLSEWVWNKLRKLAHKHVGRPFAITFAVAFIGSHLIHTWADASAYGPVTAQRATFPLSYPMTARSFLEKHGFIDREALAKQIQEEGTGGAQEAMRYPLEPIKFKAKQTGYNLQIIMIDSLRADTLNHTDTPNLTRFAQNNVNYNNHYSASNNSTSLFGLFYGLPGSYVDNFRNSDIESPILAELHNRDYQFGLFSGDNFTSSLYKQIIFTKGEIGESKEKMSDSKAISQWRDWFKAQTSGNPWFSYLELTSVSEYDATSPISTKHSDQSAFEINYRKAVRKTDQQLQTVLSALKQSPDWEKTIIVITSNHGMEFDETNTNSWGSSTNFSKYQLRVPMLIHWPEVEPELIMTRSSHLDLAPTLMESFLKTTTSPKSYSSGLNLLTQDNERNWLLAGDRKNIALITDTNTVVIDTFGNYKVYDEDYNRLTDEKPKLSLLMQGISELKRFYHPKK